jgi:hypothetical protein
MLNVTCEVHAEPAPYEFDWTFNSSSSSSFSTQSSQAAITSSSNVDSPGANKPVDPTQSTASSTPFTVSSTTTTTAAAPVVSKQVLAVGRDNFLNYTPRSASDYGDIACKAKNSVGEQSEPCWFQIIVAGKYTWS